MHTVPSILFFHVSLLKKATGIPISASPSLPPHDKVFQVPEMVIDSRLKNKINHVVSQVLAKWAGCPPELATWEDEEQIRPLLKTSSVGTTAC